MPSSASPVQPSLPTGCTVENRSILEAVFFHFPYFFFSGISPCSSALQTLAPTLSRYHPPPSAPFVESSRSLPSATYLGAGDSTGVECVKAWEGLEDFGRGSLSGRANPTPHLLVQVCRHSPSSAHFFFGDGEATLFLIRIASGDGRSLRSERSLRHQCMLVDGGAKFSCQFPEFRFIQSSVGLSAKFTNSIAEFLNLGFG
jgi:hypothetical protein